MRMANGDGDGVGGKAAGGGGTIENARSWAPSIAAENDDNGGAIHSGRGAFVVTQRKAPSRQTGVRVQREKKVWADPNGERSG